MEQMEALLRQGLNTLGLPEAAAAPLARYGELLLETNQVMNLTAITDPADVAALHFLDSAALLTLDGASLTSGEVEELRRTCLAQGGMQESPGGTSPAGAR